MSEEKLPAKEKVEIAETKPKTFVFVLMPFANDFDDIYQLGIKAACDEAGAYCERVDEQIFDGNVLQRVYNQISKADIIVAEMTGRNPNVFYEVGYAHALNKRVILLTQKADDIPFDLKQYSHIIYDGKISKMKLALEERIRWSIDNPQESLSRIDVKLDFYINNIKLDNNPEISVCERLFQKMEPSGSLTQYYQINIDIHNPNKVSVDSNDYDLAMVTISSAKIDSEYKSLRSNAISLPNGDSLYNLNTGDFIFPDGWHHFDIPIAFLNSTMKSKCWLKIFTEIGVTDYPFTISRQ